MPRGLKELSEPFPIWFKWAAASSTTSEATMLLLVEPLQLLQVDRRSTTIIKGSRTHSTMIELFVDI
jgi:hypothetical protein